LLYAAAVSLTVILVRVAWVFPATYGARLAFRGVRERDPLPPWRSVVVVSWGGCAG
jgi:CPA1 family monovalent cation:H+ antiporter